jgi:hypothetical protein
VRINARACDVKAGVVVNYRWNNRGRVSKGTPRARTCASTWNSLYSGNETSYVIMLEPFLGPVTANPEAGHTLLR